MCDSSSNFILIKLIELFILIDHSCNICHLNALFD